MESWCCLRVEREHDVLAPTPAGHAGGPPIATEASGATPTTPSSGRWTGRALRTVHIAGDSLGGCPALVLTARGPGPECRCARPVRAAGPTGRRSRELALDYFAPHAGAAAGRGAARQQASSTARQAAAARRSKRPPTSRASQPTCSAQRLPRRRPAAHIFPLIDNAKRAEGSPLDAERIAYFVRIVWGTADGMLPWPRAAARSGREAETARQLQFDSTASAAAGGLDVPGRDRAADPRLHLALRLFASVILVSLTACASRRRVRSRSRLTSAVHWGSRPARKSPSSWISAERA